MEAIETIWKLISGIEITWQIVVLAAMLLGWSIWTNIAQARTMKQKKISGRTAMIGKTGTAITALAPTGKVKVDRELWQAISQTGETIPQGKEIEVTKIKGLQLYVKEK